MSAVEFRRQSRTWFHYREFRHALSVAEFNDMLKARWNATLFGESLFMKLLDGFR